jgi:malate synthase
MIKRQSHHGLEIATALVDFVEQQVLPGTGISEQHFWRKFSAAIVEFMPRNQALLLQRQQLQCQINTWHQAHQGENFSQQQYQAFLTDIGYLEADIADFSISTEQVDAEIAELGGPQLVVPVSNARYALNATNARWGSLYDALYGTDAIAYKDNEDLNLGFNPKRGQRVIAYAKDFLDKAAPLAQGTFSQVKGFLIKHNSLQLELLDGQLTTLSDDSKFIGYTGSAQMPDVILLKNNGLHIEIVRDSSSAIGQMDPANIKDVVVEAALSTIQDCEDSIAAVDTADKIQVYGNWLGLMKGNLEQSLVKNGVELVRKMSANRHYVDRQAKPFSLSGRSVLLVRNVGHLMTTDAVLTKDGEEIPEGILDAFMTSLIALHDLNKQQDQQQDKQDKQHKNSPCGSIYIVKPKMHGSQEVAFTVDLFSAVEGALALPKNTIKIGLMDEERRTSCNLKQCLYQARERVAFINTGFMDRTGDEIHTSMAAGVMVRKDAMKNQPWIKAYEARNVALGLGAGLQGKAQIGKGMWPVPDQMANMLAQKIAHPLSGANCAWVPSPTAAVLHAMHYHQVNVVEVQQTVMSRQQASLDDLLSLPLLGGQVLSPLDIAQELTNNIQGILGYVVRWVELGIGCSKVPDINNIGLMEDRATLRISSQHIGNWLMHDLVSVAQIRTIMEKMALVVDQQNADVADYRPMADDFDQSLAFRAAFELIVNAGEQPNGYTEPLLHHYRRLAKQQS